MRNRNRKRQFTGDRHATFVNANTVNYVTNVTSVTNVVGAPQPYGRDRPHKHYGHRGRNEQKHGERPPKLARFCGSCGMIDYDVASNMSSGELCDESAKVVGYAARGFAKSVCRSARRIGGGTCQIVTGLCNIVGAFFK